MALAVFHGREADLITVGEMPGVTVEEAKLFTDPARREVDMVFQFEHVSLDQGPSGKWDYRGLDLLDLKTSWNRWQKGAGQLWGDGSPHFLSGPRIHEFLHEMALAVFHGREADLITVGEMPGVTVEEAKLFTDPARREVDMVFQFEHVSLDQGPSGKWDYRGLDLLDLKTSWNRWQKGLAETGWNSLYLNNHDQPRLVSRFGDDAAFRYESATLWAALLHLHRGTPYIYQGEELGMTNVPFISVANFQDLESVNWFREATTELGVTGADALAALRIMSRDNARTPVQWSGAPHSGFTSGTPWLAVNSNYTTINADADRASEKSVHRFYQQLIALRHGNEVVRLGRFEMQHEDHPTLYAFTRTLGFRVIRVVGNVSGNDLTLPDLQDTGGTSGLLLGNYDAGSPDRLRPWEVRILELS